MPKTSPSQAQTPAVISAMENSSPARNGRPSASSRSSQAHFFGTACRSVSAKAGNCVSLSRKKASECSATLPIVPKITSSARRFHISTLARLTASLPKSCGSRLVSSR
ncbi:hypothetical protein D3C80_1936110 [compost metagenome]